MLYTPHKKTNKPQKKSENIYYISDELILSISTGIIGIIVGFVIGVNVASKPIKTITPTSTPTPVRTYNTIPMITLNEYCQQQGFRGVVLTENDAFKWFCYDSDFKPYDIYMDNVCDWVLGDNIAKAYYYDRKDPFSWYCK
jgi:hypothetical protein